MTRLPIVATTVLAIAASAPMLWATTSPASAQEWRDRDGRGDMGDGDLRDLLRDRIRTRADLRDLIRDLLQDRRDLRRDMRERMASWRSDDDDEGGGRHGHWRERLAERMADRHHDEESEGGSCYFLTRSLRDEDGDFMIIVRRRICRD